MHCTTVSFGMRARLNDVIHCVIAKHTVRANVVRTDPVRVASPTMLIAEGRNRIAGIVAAVNFHHDSQIVESVAFESAFLRVIDEGSRQALEQLNDAAAVEIREVSGFGRNCFVERIEIVLTDAEVDRATLRNREGGGTEAGKFRPNAKSIVFLIFLADLKNV